MGLKLNKICLENRINSRKFDAPFVQKIMIDRNKKLCEIWLAFLGQTAYMKYFKDKGKKYGKPTTLRQQPGKVF